MTGSIGALALAAAAFLALHLLPSSPWRPRLTRRVGERAYLALFSVASGAALLWFALAYRDAPYVELWPAPSWARPWALGIMPIAFILALAGLTTRNPTMAGSSQKPQVGDPAPGILKVTRHPFLWAV
ncbi:MAG: NnrU family protein, partial [Alphaproteobacteria bacterium]